MELIMPFIADQEKLRKSAAGADMGSLPQKSVSTDDAWSEWLDAKRTLEEEVYLCLQRQEAIIENLLKKRREEDSTAQDAGTQPPQTSIADELTVKKAPSSKRASFNDDIEVTEITDLGAVTSKQIVKDAWATPGVPTAPPPAEPPIEIKPPREFGSLAFGGLGSLSSDRLGMGKTDSLSSQNGKKPPKEVAFDLPVKTLDEVNRPKEKEEDGKNKKSKRNPSNKRSTRTMEKTARGGYVVHYEDGRTFEKDLSLSDVISGQVDNFMKRWPKVDEPDREGCLATFIRSKPFLGFCPVVIVADAAYTTWSSNYFAVDPTRSTTKTMQVVELLFSLFYLFELTVKVIVHKRFYFFGSKQGNSWNWFDFVLVCQAFLDLILTYVVSSGGGSATFMRLLRLLKLGKILRLFRAIRFLRDLSVMIVAIMNCLVAMFWAFCVLALVLYVFALMLVQTMTGWRQENEHDELTAEAVTNFFGSVEATILSLFMSATGGISWIDMYKVVQLGGFLPCASYIFFIGFFGFAVITILSGIFIEKALTASQPDRESMALEQRRAEEEEACQMKDLIMSMDTDRSGTLTLEEFTEASEDLYVKSYLRSLGLDIQDGVMFFNLLASLNGSYELPIEDFVKRLGRMKGAASSMDLQSLMFEVSVLRKEINQLEGTIVASLPRARTVSQRHSLAQNPQCSEPEV